MPPATLATRYSYDPYGNKTQTGTANTNPYTYTGQEDDGTGLGDLGNAITNAAAEGKFMSWPAWRNSMAGRAATAGIRNVVAAVTSLVNPGTPSNLINSLVSQTLGIEIGVGIENSIGAASGGDSRQ